MFNYCAVVAPRNPEKQGEVLGNHLYGNYCVIICEAEMINFYRFRLIPRKPDMCKTLYCCSEVVGHQPGGLRDCVADGVPGPPF